jgi:hypothetical protein
MLQEVCAAPGSCAVLLFSAKNAEWCSQHVLETDADSGFQLLGQRTIARPVVQSEVPCVQGSKPRMLPALRLQGSFATRRVSR